jgi:UDP-N-acetylglucosamine--N-acetylmuramyl-(pentapeptide) pyrophosphoryl-undecaprenol N-acetylglucosamine transferase
MKLLNRLLVAGGGTGGHLLAGVAVADAWRVENGKDTSILFVGAVGGLEEKLVPQAGYPLKLLKLGSLNRVSIRRRLKTAIQLPIALVRAISILLRFRPNYILGVGGYSSGPVVLMAQLLHFVGILKIRIGILEQNAVPGMTNRILGRFSQVVFVAFPGMDGHFPNKEVIQTGNPIRSSMKLLPSAPRLPFTLFIFGGSQGASGINSLVLAALPHLGDFLARIRFIHQTGEKDFDRVRDGYQKLEIPARVEKFIYDMPAAYSAASLLICRAGSSTLSEIAAVGRAALLIPLPTAADNHQEKNARAFFEAGSASLLRQQEAKGEDLARLIREFILDEKHIVQMEKSVVQFCRPRAAEDVVRGLQNG